MEIPKVSMVVVHDLKRLQDYIEKWELKQSDIINIYPSYSSYTMFFFSTDKLREKIEQIQKLEE